MPAPGLVGLLLLQVGLGEVRVDVRVTPEGARVTASYSLVETPGPVVFTAIKLDGQEVVVEGFEGLGSPPKIRTLDGLYRFLIADPPAGSFRVRYRVTGDVRKIPLFVPDQPTQADGSSITIRLAGVAAGARARGGFPRMVRGADGVFLANPRNLPSFLILPASADTLTLNQAADITVVLLIVAASAFWGWTQRSTFRGRR